MQTIKDFPVKKIFTTWCHQKKLDIKPHQIDGIEWMINRERKPEFGSPGGFLCDEMGLGKTILMIGVMVLNPKLHNLIVLPKSLIEQWCEAVTRFTALDKEDILVYHGAMGRSVKPEEIGDYRVVITTYGMIATRKVKSNKPVYKSPLWSQKWDRIIYDESHHLRNNKTSKFNGANLLKAPIKWMVTGTPINNKKRDFYIQSLIQGSGSHFRPNKKSILLIVDAIVLRRTKKEIGIKMPQLNENTVEVKWVSPEEEVFVRNIHNLMKFAPVTPTNVDSVIQNLGSMYQSIFPLFMLMRQACVKPSLAFDALRRRGLVSDLQMVNQLVDSPTSSKMDSVVSKVVENRYTNKAKLIFCLFRTEMEDLKEKLRKEGFNPIIINGSTTKKQRKFALQAGVVDEQWKNICPRFPSFIGRYINSYISPDVLIAQIQTSCEGLNLQHFAEVYFTTPHWNPAIESQAIARCHRIGQKKDVDVYRFVTTFHDTEDESSMSLDQYCIEVQRVKKDIALGYGL
jgi:SNF2 family DNA or RNA helicase